MFTVDGVREYKGIPVVGSLDISRVFGKRHDRVLRAIENATDPNNGVSEFIERNFIKSTYTDSTGRKLPEVLMTRNGFSLIAMGFTGKKAFQFKVAYIQKFDEMEQFIETLLAAKKEYPEFTNAILNAHEEPKHYHFSNETDMIYGIVLGMSAKKYRQEYGVDGKLSIRHYLTLEQLSAVKKLQSHDIGLLVTEPDYQLRKEMLTKYFERMSTLRIVGKGDQNVKTPA